MVSFLRLVENVNRGPEKISTEKNVPKQTEKKNLLKGLELSKKFKWLKPLNSCDLFFLLCFCAVFCFSSFSSFVCPLLPCGILPYSRAILFSRKVETKRFQWREKMLRLINRMYCYFVPCVLSSIETFVQLFNHTKLNDCCL